MVKSNRDTVNIVTLLWKGDFRGRDYQDHHVVSLERNIASKIDRPYNFYTLTNDMGADLPGEKIGLVNDWPGWWSKVELFRPDLPCGRTLYLDLDTYIVRSLQPILDTKGDLVMFPTTINGDSQWTRDGWLIPRYQAGTMLFAPGQLSWVYSKFKSQSQRLMQKYRSDQDIYAVWLPTQPTFPRHWLMKKREFERVGGIGDNTIIVTGNKDGTFENEQLRQLCM